MSRAGFEAVEKLSLSSVLGQTLAALTRQPRLFFGLALLESLPGLIPQLLLERFVAAMSLGAGLLALTLTLALMLWNLVCQGAFAHSAFWFLREGEGPGLGEALRRGFHRLPSLLWATFLFSLALGAVGALGAAVLIPSVMMGAWAILGFIAYISVVALLFFSLYLLYIPACVIEGRGGLDSLRRSQALTKGSRLPLLGLLALLGLGSLVWAGLAGAAGADFLPDSVAILVTGLIFGCPPLAFFSVALTVVFRDLKAIHEGPDLEALAGVFD